MKSFSPFVKSLSVLVVLGCANATIEDDGLPDDNDGDVGGTGGKAGSGGTGNPSGGAMGDGDGDGDGDLIGDTGGSPGSGGSDPSSGGSDGSTGGAGTGGASPGCPAEWSASTIYCPNSGSFDRVSKDNIEYECCYYNTGIDPAMVGDATCEEAGAQWRIIGPC